MFRLKMMVMTVRSNDSVDDSEDVADEYTYGFTNIELEGVELEQDGGLKRSKVSRVYFSSDEDRRGRKYPEFNPDS